MTICLNVPVRGRWDPRGSAPCRLQLNVKEKTLQLKTATCEGGRTYQSEQWLRFVVVAIVSCGTLENQQRVSYNFTTVMVRPFVNHQHLRY